MFCKHLGAKHVYFAVDPVNTKMVYMETSCIGLYKDNNNTPA